MSVETLLSQVQPPAEGYIPVYSLGPFRKKEDADKARIEWKEANRKCWKNGGFDIEAMKEQGAQVAKKIGVGKDAIRNKAELDYDEVPRRADPDSIEVAFKQMKTGDVLPRWPGSPFKIHENALKHDVNNEGPAPVKKDTPAMWIRRRPVFSSRNGNSEVLTNSSSKPPMSDSILKRNIIEEERRPAVTPMVVKSLASPVTAIASTTSNPSIVSDDDFLSGGNTMKESGLSKSFAAIKL